MQGGTSQHYPHPMAMDLHVPQTFPYYAGCIMDNQAMFTAQQMQYNKMYAAGIDPSGRILEMRKEKSRDAARSRRGKENYEFYELAKMLPLPGAITSQLDKASIVRLTIAYLRLREFANHGDPPWNRDGRFDGKASLKRSVLRRGPLGGNLATDIFEEHEGTHILQSLDGFAISLAADGRFLYISETVSIYLGLSQVELTGSSIFDYVHQADHQELADQIGVTLASPGDSPHQGEEGGPPGGQTVGPTPPIPDVCYPVVSLMCNGRENKEGKPSYERAFCIRMKSTLTKRGCHFKSSGYRVVLMLGKLRPQYNFSQQKKSSVPITGFIGLAIALPPPSVHEIAHCEPKVSDLLDYSADDLTGVSMYSLCHALDVDKIRQTHTDLIKKGQVMSMYYRFMNRRGGYTWVQTCATLVCNTKNNDEQTIICVNYVLSGPQHAHVVMDIKQTNLSEGILSSPDSCDPPKFRPQEEATPVRPQSTSFDSGDEIEEKVNLNLAEDGLDYSDQVKIGQAFTNSSTARSTKRARTASSSSSPNDNQPKSKLKLAAGPLDASNPLDAKSRTESATGGNGSSPSSSDTLVRNTSGSSLSSSGPVMSSPLTGSSSQAGHGGGVNISINNNGAPKGCASPLIANHAFSPVGAAAMHSPGTPLRPSPSPHTNNNNNNSTTLSQYSDGGSTTPLPDQNSNSLDLAAKQSSNQHLPQSSHQHHHGLLAPHGMVKDEVMRYDSDQQHYQLPQVGSIASPPGQTSSLHPHHPHQVAHHHSHGMDPTIGLDSLPPLSTNPNTPLDHHHPLTGGSLLATSSDLTEGGSGAPPHLEANSLLLKQFYSRHMTSSSTVSNSNNTASSSPSTPTTAALNSPHSPGYLTSLNGGIGPTSAASEATNGGGHAGLIGGPTNYLDSYPRLGYHHHLGGQASSPPPTAGTTPNGHTHLVGSPAVPLPLKPTPNLYGGMMMDPTGAMYTTLSGGGDQVNGQFYAATGHQYHHPVVGHQSQHHPAAASFQLYNRGQPTWYSGN